MSGDLYLYRLGQENPIERLTQSEDHELDPQFSPNGNFVSFIKNHNIFVINLKTMKEQQLSFRGTEDRPIGVAEFIAQEEMNRYRGYWWSPDEKYIAATRPDLTPVENIERFEIYADQVKVINQRYPRAGSKNAKVDIKIFSLAKMGGKQKPIEVPRSNGDYYLPQLSWTKSKNNLEFFYGVQNRDQSQIDYFLFNMKNKKARLLFSEKDEAWVNIRHDYRFLKKQPALLWVSDRNGHNHILRISLKDGAIKELTRGPWDVRQLEGVDEDRGRFFFTATKTSPLENQLYEGDLNSEGSLSPLSKGDGYHSIIIPQKPLFYIDYYSSPTHPTSIAVHGMDGKRRFFIDENRLDEKHPMHPYLRGLSNWEFHTFKKEGQPEIHYKILKPKNFDPFKKYPLIQYVYGGPGVQLVTKAWSGRALFQQILAQEGFVVLVGDNRGTPHRGRDFEKSYKNQFGQLEVTDQSELLNHVIKENSFINGDRVGVYGHSYGGYLTLMLLMQKPELYKVGVSGAPVVDWKLYDTHYTERFIGTPQENKEVYEKSNVLTYADNLKGHLLVAHGMADDNVLYSNSLMLYSELQEKGKLFDIQAYPGAKHGIRRKKSWQYHYQLSTLNYFKKNL